jgi:hypothetical protein
MPKVVDIFLMKIPLIYLFSHRALGTIWAGHFKQRWLFRCHTSLNKFTYHFSFRWYEINYHWRAYQLMEFIIFRHFNWYQNWCWRMGCFLHVYHWLHQYCLRISNYDCCISSRLILRFSRRVEGFSAYCIIEWRLSSRQHIRPATILSKRPLSPATAISQPPHYFGSFSRHSNYFALPFATPARSSFCRMHYLPSHLTFHLYCTSRWRKLTMPPRRWITTHARYTLASSHFYERFDFFSRHHWSPFIALSDKFLSTTSILFRTLIIDL